jgi:hypothetical protein
LLSCDQEFEVLLDCQKCYISGWSALFIPDSITGQDGSCDAATNIVQGHHTYILARQTYVFKQFLRLLSQRRCENL